MFSWTNTNRNNIHNPSLLGIRIWLLFFTANTNMLHSQIRTPWNSNNDYDLSTWVGEQPCMQMDFWPFDRNADTHIIPGKMSKIHLHAWLFSNSREKSLFLLKRLRQICPLDLILLRSCPNGLENNHACKWFSDNFPGIINMY